MPLTCDACPYAGDGCQRADYTALVQALLQLAESHKPGVKLVGPILSAMAASLLYATGCRATASNVLFPLTCTVSGLQVYLDYAVTQHEKDTFLRDLLGREGE